MSKIIASPNWRYKLTIKENFEDEVEPELIIRLVTKINKQLIQIREKVINSYQIHPEEAPVLEDKLTECIDNFEFIMHLADGTIDADNWDQYNFDGDFEELFNDYLAQLYDLADERILLKNNTTEKFIWIE